MKNATKQWVSLAAAGLLLAGCAAGPQRSPAPNAINGVNKTASSTTGDMDACAVALGNSPLAGAAAVRGTSGTPTAMAPGIAATPGTTAAAGGATGAGGATAANPGITRARTPNMEVTANGVLLGNVAVVALPASDNMTVTPGTTGAAPGTTGMAPGTTGAAPGTTGAAPGTTGAAPGTTGAAPGTTGAAGTAGTAGGAGTAVAPGTAATPGNTVTGAPIGPGGNLTAIDRIRAACAQVVEIRVVNAARDRERLAEVALSIRKGEPITNFMTEVAAMSTRADIAWHRPVAAAPAPVTP